MNNVGVQLSQCFNLKKDIFPTLFNNDPNYIPTPTAYPLGVKI